MSEEFEPDQRQSGSNVKVKNLTLDLLGVENQIQQLMKVLSNDENQWFGLLGKQSNNQLHPQSRSHQNV